MDGGSGLMSFLEASVAYSLNGTAIPSSSACLNNRSAFYENTRVAQPLEGNHMHISHGPYARKFRGNSRNVLGSQDVAHKLKEVLEATYDGDPSKHKAAAQDSASSPRAAENWFAADNPMSLTAFLNAYHANPTFKAWARKLLLLEEDHDPEFQAQLAKFIQAAQRVGT
jgi:hypothetical protein